MELAFAVDALQDMTAFSFLGPHFGVIKGRDAIVGMASSTVGWMDTTHMASNFRTEVSDDGNSARLTCCALAQHWIPGHGKSHAFGDDFLMGNRYEGKLVSDGVFWVFKELVIFPQWTQGSSGVFDIDSWPVVHQAVRAGIW